MKQICILTGSPRAGGSSDTLAALMAEVLMESGASVEVIHTRDYVLRPCISCGYCDTHSGSCPLDHTAGLTPHGKKGHDAAGEILERLTHADMLAFAFPVYFYGPPAHFKALIDRAQRFWALRWDTGEPVTTPVQRPMRPALAVMCAARTAGERLFDANLLILRCFLNALGYSLAEPLLLRGIETKADLPQTDDLLHSLRDYMHNSPNLLSEY